MPSFGLETLKLDRTSSQLDLSSHVEYLSDASGKLSYADVVQLKDESWKHTGLGTPSFGFSKSAYWFRIELHNPSGEVHRSLIEIANAKLNQVDLFQTVDQQLIQRFNTGVDLPFDERPVVHRNFLFPLTMQADSISVIHVRVLSNGSLRLPISLWNEGAFYEHNQNEMLALGAYFGVLLLVLGYVLLMQVTIPHQAFLAFAGFIGSFGLFQLSTLGIGLEYIWTDHPQLNEFSTIISICFGIACACWFTMSILDLKHHSLAAFRFLQVMIILLMMTSAAYLLLPFNLIAPLAGALAIPACLGILCIGVFGSLTGFRLAKYFTLSWTVLLLGIITLVLNRFALVPANLHTEQAAFIGFIGMVILMSWAFAGEVSKLRYQDQQIGLSIARQAGVRSQTIATELEQKVEERTRELELALTELSDSNTALMELSTIDGLTGLKNRHYFDEIYLQEWKRATRESYPISLLLVDIDHFKSVNDTYGHLAGDDCLRRVAQNIKHILRRPADILARYGGEEFVVVLPYTANENAVLLAEQIRQEIEATTITADNLELALTISIGVSTVIPQDQDERRDLISSADIALYEAKRSGRNKVCNAGNLQVHKSAANSKG